MIILIYVHFNMSISIFIKKEYLNNISFLEVSINIQSIPETQKVLVCVTLINSICTIKNYVLKTVLSSC